ncbi:hypothetical protein P2318_34430 [Myxococcaceae bacterium GXIMD 01537]
MRLVPRAWRHAALEAPEPGSAWSLPREVLLPGALAGTLGALGMLGVACALGALRGEAWRPLELAAGLFFRADGGQGVPGALVGLAVHLAVAGGLATGFALLLPREGGGVAALGLAALYVLALWPVMVLLVLPFGSPPLHRADPGAPLLLLHLVFGAALATVPALRRAVGRNRSRAPA